MLELLVGMVILGVLGAIGYGIYTNFISDARDTALDQNIQTAAAELQSVLALEPTLADNTGGVPGDELVTALTNRTNFVWNNSWEFVTGDAPDTMRFQFIGQNGTEDHADGANPPEVGCLVDSESAVRMHITNPEGEWRCALLILKPSPTSIKPFLPSTANDDADAAAKAAELRGIWFDGGSNIDSAAYDGLHDCSPVGALATGSISSAVTVFGGGCTFGAADPDSDDCLPDDAQTWVIPDATSDHVDSTSTGTAGYRTLHRSASSLDSNA